MKKDCLLDNSLRFIWNDGKWNEFIVTCHRIKRDGLMDNSLCFIWNNGKWNGTGNKIISFGSSGMMGNGMNL